MTARWLGEVAALAAREPVVRALIVEARGSTPRDAGAAMLITGEQATGSIGGGALEFDVVAKGRAMLAGANAGEWSRALETYHLGPDLEQCCGGLVRVLLERYGRREAVSLAALASGAASEALVHPFDAGMPLTVASSSVDVGAAFVEWSADARTLLFVYGAGHVGRAIVHAAGGLPFAIGWIDIAPDRFPSDVGGAAEVHVAEAPEVAAKCAPAGAFHLVMTHSHALDERIVAALLDVGTFGYLGLIGSATKRARFVQRLARDGYAADVIARVHCPVGLPEIAGKEPATIAISVLADLLRRRQNQDLALTARR